MCGSPAYILRHASLRLQEPTHHNPPVLQRREQSQSKVETERVVLMKSRTHREREGLRLLAWQGEVVVRRVRPVIARILSPSLWNKGELQEDGGRKDGCVVAMISEDTRFGNHYCYVPCMN